MRNAPIDEPNQEPDLDEREDHQEDDAPIIAGVGSSSLGSIDFEPEENEPQERRHPDNDGETVEA